MGKAFDRANKYAVTRGSQSLEWQNSHRLRGIDEVAALKRTDGKRIVIEGSSTLYPGLLAAGLIDELTLMTFPVTLGHGKRLLGEGTPVDRLEMTGHRVTAKGTVISTYRPGGTLPPYPPEAPIPITSDREIERQAKITAGTW
jgi:dihydrofolate reductase